MPIEIDVGFCVAVLLFHLCAHVIQNTYRSHLWRHDDLASRSY